MQCVTTTLLSITQQTHLLTHVKPFLKRFLLAFVFMTIVALFTGLFTLMIQLVMDELSVQAGKELTAGASQLRNFVKRLFGVQENQLVMVFPILLFVTFLGQSVFNFLSLYFMKTLGLKVVRNIRDLVYQKLICHSVDFLSKARTGDLVSRLSNDIDKVKVAVSETLSVYVRESLTLIVLLVVVFTRDWYMALISLTLGPFAGVLLVTFAKKVKKRGIQSQEAIGELSNFLAETVMGNKIVKAYNMEGYEVERFSKLNQNHYRINSKIALIYSLASPIMNLIGGVVAALIFIVGMNRVANGILSLGQFTAFLAALFLMYSPLKRLSQANNEFQQGRAGFERVKQIIESENPIKDRADAVAMKDIQGRVEFKGVFFAYSTAMPVIKNISLKINPGEVIALVGASGSGKSTLVNLLLRFYDANAGEIFIDNRNIKTFTLRSLRNAIGLVTQDVFLFNDTIHNNIAYGDTHYGIESVKEAASIARAAGFIEALPQQYESMVGERGVFLSTGQRQRISIARAILKTPPILIFDEATSSLDTESEKLIQEAMVDVMANRTTFVIAHRLSTIVEADMILVIDKGEVKEMGNHQQLIKKQGLYHSLYNLQFPDMDIIM